MKKILAAVLLIAVTSSSALTAATYDIKTFSAVSDTTHLSTMAVQQAIDMCNSAGGGTVIVPAGSYKIGSIELKSNVTLSLENGATLYGSTDFSDYKPMTSGYVSLHTVDPTVQLIYADGASNVAIIGQGTIDGRGKAFPKQSLSNTGATRPGLLRLIGCTDINISGVTLKNSGSWMQHYLACDRLKIDGITVVNRNNYDNDALNLDGCHDVTVSNMIADSDDDAITLKSSSPRLCEDITISNCVVSSHCNAIKLGAETTGGFRNINIRGIVVKPSSNQSTLISGLPIGLSAISLEIVDGGLMNNVNIGDITIRGTEAPIFVRLANRARPYADSITVKNVGTISGILLHDIIIDGAGSTGCSITGIEGHPVSDVRLHDITIRHAGGQGVVEPPTDEKVAETPEATMWGVLPAKGFWLNHVRNVKVRNVTVITDAPDERPQFISTDAEGFSVQ